jgi:hypothetical protein
MWLQFLQITDTSVYITTWGVLWNYNFWHLCLEFGKLLRGSLIYWQSMMLQCWLVRGYAWVLCVVIYFNRRFMPWIWRGIKVLVWYVLLARYGAMRVKPVNLLTAVLPHRSSFHVYAMNKKSSEESLVDVIIRVLMLQCRLKHTYLLTATWWSLPSCISNCDWSVFSCWL